MAVWSTVALSKLGHALRLEAEYYHPRYLAMNQKIVAAGATPITSYIEYVTDGTHITPHYVSNGIPFLSSSDIDSFLFPHEYEKFISQTEHESLSHCQPKAGDLLISKSGRIGTCAVVPKRIKRGDVNIYEGLALVRTKGIDSHFLAAFMNSKYGQMQIRRELKGVAQPHLHLEDLRRIRIVVPNEDVTAISMLVKKGMEADDNSYANYRTARSLLSSALKENELKFDRKLSYTTRFSDVMREGRADAEFFHAKYQPILDLIKQFPSGFDRLGDISRRVEVNFAPENTLCAVNYTEIGDVDISTGRYTYSVLDPSALPANAKIKLRGGELLISTVRPTRGAIAIVDDKLPNGINVCSGAFYVCHIEDKSRREVIWLYLRIVKSLFEKYCGGTSYPTIDAAYLRNFPIPRFDQQLSDKIKRLIVESKEEAARSESLLAAAKARVEELIESAVK